MISTKFLTSLFILSAIVGITLASYDDWYSDDNQGSDDVQDPFLMSMPMFFKREMASDFTNQLERREDEFYKRLFKSKQDPEEIWETDLKADARRRKAYRNYEEACEIKGKFKVRTCLPIKECFAKNKQTFIPLLSEKANATATKPASQDTKKPIKGNKREFIERALALSFLENELEDDQDDSGDFFKRFLFKKNPNAELVEETKERKTKAFKKYEEYCERRIFRIGSKRNCPPLDSKLC